MRNANVAGLHLVVALRQPREHGVRRRHGVVDEQRERNDERTQRYALHVDATSSMTENTMASVSGMASAMTRPGRTPRLMKLTTRMIATACHSDVMNSAMALPTVTAWSATSVGVMPSGRSAVISCHRPLDVLAEREDVAAVAHGDGKADGRLAIDAKHRLRRIGKAPPDLGDVAEAQHAAAGGEVDVRYILLGSERARYAQRERLVAGLDRAGRMDDVLRLQGGDQAERSMPRRGQLLHRELDEDPLVLGAQDLDLGDVGNAEQLRADGSRHSRAARDA